MKQYKFEVIITEGNDEFWEDIAKSKLTGIDDVMSSLVELLYPVDPIIKFIEYKE